MCPERVAYNRSIYIPSVPSNKGTVDELEETERWAVRHEEACAATACRAMDGTGAAHGEKRASQRPTTDDGDADGT